MEISRIRVCYDDTNFQVTTYHQSRVATWYVIQQYSLVGVLDGFIDCMILIGGLQFLSENLIIKVKKHLKRTSDIVWGKQKIFYKYRDYKNSLLKVQSLKIKSRFTLTNITTLLTCVAASSNYVTDFISLSYVFIKTNTTCMKEHLYDYEIT